MAQSDSCLRSSQIEQITPLVCGSNWRNSSFFPVPSPSRRFLLTAANRCYGNIAKGRFLFRFLKMGGSRDRKLPRTNLGGCFAAGSAPSCLGNPRILLPHRIAACPEQDGILYHPPVQAAKANLRGVTVYVGRNASLSTRTFSLFSSPVFFFFYTR